MSLDRLGADAQGPGDRLGGLPRGDPAEDLELPGGEALGGPGLAPGPADVVGDGLPGDLRAEVRLALHDRPDRQLELGGAGTLQQVAPGTGEERLADVF